jgi:RNA 2',3'-cyclic 3'-phosphodiesterase
VSAQRLPSLCDALNTLRSDGQPLTLWAHAIECFPERGPVTTVTLSLAGERERLVLFQAALEHACERLGFPSERRAFVPHITIARARPPLHSRAREEFMGVTPPRSANSEFAVDKFVLMQSHLKPGGPEYIRLATFPMAGGGVA